MRTLLRLYPRRWRERYAEEFELVLRAAPPDVLTALDVFGGALDAHVRDVAAHPGRLLRWALLAVCAAAVGWLDVHATDDVQPVAAALLVFAFGFGLHRPGRVWLAALALFSAVPLAELWADGARLRPAALPPAPLYETLIALIPALLGAYAGAAVRWGVGRAARG